MSNRSLLRALLVSTASCIGLVAPATAQVVPPARQSIDANGVDLFLGTLSAETPAVSMGGDQGLSYRWYWKGSGWRDELAASLYKSGSQYTVSFADKSENFVLSGGVYTSSEGKGSTLTFNGTTVYTYTRSDGTIANFSKTVGPSTGYEALATDVTKPSGDKLTYNYQSSIYCSRSKQGADDQICLAHATAYRLAGVTSNYGYRISLGYVNDLALDPDESPPDLLNWFTQTGGGITNLAAPSAPSSDLSVIVTVSGGYSYATVTDSLSRVTVYRSNGLQLLGIKRPGSSSEDVTFAYTSGRVSSVTTAAGTVNYASSDAGGVRTVTVTDPLSHTTTYAFDIASQRMTSVTDALGHATSYQYDAKGRLTRVTAPEGNYVQTTYQSLERPNVTQTDMVAKSGSGLSTITTTASFDATCSNPVTCNQPNTTTDAKGNVTDYTYDATYGNLLTVMAPAPSAGAVRPKTTYSYSSLQAYYNVGSGIVASGQPVRRLTGISTCQTTASCAGAVDEVKTTIDYGPQTTGIGNNLLPVSISKGAGNGSLTATTAFGYDAVGNQASVDGPLSGTADTTTYRYDAARQLVGVISADPDGSGALKRRAKRVTYSPHGIPTVTEVGTVNGTTDTDWTAFTSAQQITTTLDAADRKVKDVLTASGTTYQVAQYNYDAAGRLDCTVLRMNSATWGSLPSSACTLATTGSAGPDRITKTTYDNANRPTLVQTAYGTGDQADEVATSYTNNGQVATVTDGQGNKTTYEYDGVDRLAKTRYPNTTAGSGTSSTTDYEQFIYDANGNVNSRRLRGYAGDVTQHIDYSYDNLNRVTLKDTPDSGADVSYTYDLLGRPTLASTSGQAIYFTYDALGRKLTESGPVGTITSQYDLAGRRTLLTWPDSFYVAYDYLVTGEMTKVRENGAASGVGVLATYSYDDLGRRTGITRGNGTTTSYGLDNISRLTSLGQDLAGTGYDLTLGLGHNPANQIIGATRSNDAYAYGGSANAALGYTVNGLNQVTAVGAGSVTYDARGNLATTGSNSYGYSSENLLRTGPSSNVLYYDPLLRLFQINSTDRFGYDGQRIIGEYSTANALARRYVFGSRVDEPLVWYEGSGTTDRRWLHSDERGSIVAVTNASGVAVGINSYEEYGVPASGNIGRFQYTGQAYISEFGMYYYKARIYSARLGRFLQTDPIGYRDGLNWYNYVDSDPINKVDPTGTAKWEWRCYGNCGGGYWNTGIGNMGYGGTAAVLAVTQEGGYQVNSTTTKSTTTTTTVTTTTRTTTSTTTTRGSSGSGNSSSASTGRVDSGNPAQDRAIAANQIAQQVDQGRYGTAIGLGVSNWPVVVGNIVDYFIETLPEALRENRRAAEEIDGMSTHPADVLPE